MSEIHDRLSALHLPRWIPESAGPDSWQAVRSSIISTLLTNEYGTIPACPFRLEHEILSEDPRFCAGKGPLKALRLTLTFEEGKASFPAWLMTPSAPGEHPLFVSISFHPGMPNDYLPAEEICDRGYAVLALEHNSISPDRQDHFGDGLGRLLRLVAANSGIPEAQLPGKIAIWAWAASRALDWAWEQPGISRKHIAVIGHSRLGKTALLCGMLDERFSCVISNESGCSGAAVTRGKEGEHVADITGKFPFWFCDAYQQYANREDSLPFDQDWLLASIAPRLLLVGSAVGDPWSGPGHEYLSCVSASKAWELLGKPGFVHPDRFPETGEVFHEGSVGYHLRSGLHFLSREDWNLYIDFLSSKGW